MSASTNRSGPEGPVWGWAKTGESPVRPGYSGCRSHRNRTGHLPTTQERRAAGLVLATFLAASLTACGGSDDPTTTGPTSVAPSSPPPSESATPSPSESASLTTRATSTVAPLSRFEDDPAVRGARAWAQAIATDINKGDLAFAASTPLTVPAARKDLKFYASKDIAAKLQYPGPLPFAPVRVHTAGTMSTVVTCTWTQGWGIDPSTHKPVQKRTIAGDDFVMKKTASGYKFVNLIDNSTDCSDINVKGIPS